ncbi:MAG: HEAT repeat domain-containing protein [Planctomycetaceae bacterium]|nr:HEAT repeat domain-containing protein [Planctomycetaceae bacterium]
MMTSLLFVAALIPGAGDPGEAARSTEQEATYDGLTLAEWRIRIKSLDLKDPASAEAVPGLIAIVSDRRASWVSRRQAAETLGRLGSLAPEGVAVLLKTIDEESPDEIPPRIWSLKALSLYGPVARAAAPRLLKILRDPTRPLIERQLSLEALAQIGPTQPLVLPALIALLQSPEGGERPAAAAGTSTNDQRELRELAVETFTLIGPNGAPAIPSLVRLAHDSSDVLRMKVAQALGAMGSRAEIAIPTLVELLVLDDVDFVRGAAAAGLAKVGLEAVPTLIQLLEVDEPAVRWRAAEALGQTGRAGRAAVDPLTQRLQDDSSEVRIRAAEALWKLTRDGLQAAPSAALLLGDEDRQVRLRAFRLLTSMGPRASAARPQLELLERDERGQVREAARRVKERLARKPNETER